VYVIIQTKINVIYDPDCFHIKYSILVQFYTMQSANRVLCEVFFFFYVSRFDIVENPFSHRYVVGNINRIEMVSVASFAKLPVHKYVQKNQKNFIEHLFLVCCHKKSRSIDFPCQ